MSSNQLSKILHALEMWKEKAMHRRKQVKQLKKRLKELRDSRECWKMKAKAQHMTIHELQVELKHLRTQMTTPQKNSRGTATLQP